MWASKDANLPHKSISFLSCECQSTSLYAHLRELRPKLVNAGNLPVLTRKVWKRQKLSLFHPLPFRVAFIFISLPKSYLFISGLIVGNYPTFKGLAGDHFWTSYHSLNWDLNLCFNRDNWDSSASLISIFDYFVNPLFLSLKLPVIKPEFHWEMGLVELGDHMKAVRFSSSNQFMLIRALISQTAGPSIWAIHLKNLW